MNSLSKLAPLEIARVLVCTTAHVTEEEANRLGTGGFVGGLNAGFVRGEGFMVYTGSIAPDQILEPASVGFQLAVATALANNCQWLMFDCDGPTLPGVPSYDW